MESVSGRLMAVCAGPVRRLAGLGRWHRTAFVKHEISGRVRVGMLGVDGDEHIYHAHGGEGQADPIGGETRPGGERRPG